MNHPVDIDENLYPSTAPINSDLTTKKYLSLIQLQGMSREFRYTGRVWEDHIYPYPMTA